ncbi:zinc-binding dehydrogenase [Ornithinimicrobium murale]|uniref:zinc-binding dehydrogenase n=1 Tax=Ornithinimicrobium murale TaxID=1050153 RepID=UPI000E0D5A16|nr:zinc-binding dehydrogenase [Ornithinimicrobium murale]
MTSKRAAVLTGFNEPIEILDVPGSDLVPGAVLVDIEYGGVCGTDVHLHQGRLPVPTPLILGHEAVGRVAELGEGVTTDALGQTLAEGDTVTWASSIPCRTCYYCVIEKEFSLCEKRVVYGINQTVSSPPHLSGGWAEQIYLRPGSTIVRLPSGVSSLQAVSLGCAGPTVAHALLRIAPPRIGEFVVVQGSGPVGMAAAMYARLAGAGTVVMIGGPASRLALAEALGICDLTVDIDENPRAVDRLDEVLGHTPGRRGADLVIEAAGVPVAVAEGIDLCKRNGRYLVVGQYTDHGTTPINPHLITKKQLQVMGSWAFGAEDFIAYVQTLPSLVSRFNTVDLVSEYRLEEVNVALQDMRTGRAMKPVLVP